MDKTKTLSLATIKPSEWSSTYYKDLLTALAGTDSTSNMQIIDAAIAALRSDKAAGTHASQHATGGSDPITPENIGAEKAGAAAAALDKAKQYTDDQIKVAINGSY